MRCRSCGSDDTVPFETPGGVGNWSRCLMCGSDSSDAEFDPDIYDETFMPSIIKCDWETRLDSLRAPADWYQHFPLSLPRDFLDVGFGDDAMMELMQKRGWSVHGFDINKSAYRGSHTTIAPRFRASLFPQRYSGVFAGDVLEHTPSWKDMLIEINTVMEHWGLLQVDMPRPTADPERIPHAYCRGHLAIPSPAAFRNEVVIQGFEVLDHRYEVSRQHWMLRKIGGF